MSNFFDTLREELEWEMLNLITAPRGKTMHFEYGKSPKLINMIKLIRTLSRDFATNGIAMDDWENWNKALDKTWGLKKSKDFLESCRDGFMPIPECIAFFMDRFLEESAHYNIKIILE
jgi:hypothetical protein